MWEKLQGPEFDATGALLTIDLGALRANYRYLRDLLGRAACAAVVKADGYGLGAAPVARALLGEGCTTFFVAHASEGLALRAEIGSGPEIFILNGIFQGAEDACADAGLIPVANSADQLAAWSAAALRRGDKLPVAVQVDSGMSRLGMAPSEVERLARDPRAFDGLDVRLVMSHLARADEPQDPANDLQRANFEVLRGRLPAAPASLANSSGILLGQDFHYDLARPGAALYGINPTPGLPNPMRPVIRIEARVIQVRELGAGVGVGYGYAYRAASPHRAATIALGYADGWPRRAAASAFLDGVSLPFIGRVSMDSIILDISGLPEGRLRPGDMVELVGEHRGVDDLAAIAVTIGYEILTGLGRRFHRRYIDTETRQGTA